MAYVSYSNVPGRLGQFESESQAHNPNKILKKARRAKQFREALDFILSPIRSSVRRISDEAAPPDELKTLVLIEKVLKHHGLIRRATGAPQLLKQLKKENLL